MMLRWMVAGVIVWLLVIAIAVSFAAKPAHASDVYIIDLPPLRFQHDGVVSPVYFSNQKQVDELCGKSPDARYTKKACATVGGGAMVLPNPCSLDFFPEKYAAIVCHEMAHINGWAKTHGD